MEKQSFIELYSNFHDFLAIPANKVALLHHSLQCYLFENISLPNHFIPFKKESKLKPMRLKNKQTLCHNIAHLNNN